MKGKGLFEVLKKRFSVKTGNQLNTLLDNKNTSQYSKQDLTPVNIAGFIEGARKNARETAVRTVVEFFPIAQCKSSHDKNFELFNVGSKKDASHPYLTGLRNELEQTKGVYVFFDGIGRILYVGRTKGKFWDEMNLVFNRNFSKQEIFHVSHPKSRKTYKSSNEMSRSIKPMKIRVKLHELAFYFSAYEVHEDMIGVIEALLIRVSANHSFNKKMENIQKKKKKKEKIIN